MVRTVLVAGAALLAGALVFGCHANSPDGRFENACFERCTAVARQCSEDECVRGCRFELDRLLERETEPMVACVGRGRACDDTTWAECAVRIGPHADGGPPAPPPPDDDFE